MSVDAATVRKIARLAHIKLKEEEVAPLARELSGILAWIEQLDEVDTTEVAPLASTVNAKLPWRKDAVADGGYREKILRNAPEAVEGFFAVPKVIE
ncbi:MAG: Asp-tRNA(Asn)/Glu-tRNA(Gln) amidotransferase subunit GatC [Alphaproteobacteria bacterium]